jgi:hypothetical protein
MHATWIARHRRLDYVTITVIKPWFAGTYLKNTFYHTIISDCSREFTLNAPVFRRTSGWNLWT